MFRLHRALTLCVLCITAACSQEQETSVPAAADPGEVSAVVAVAPQFGTWGVDVSSQNSTVKPGDDFFRFANGTWYENFEIPPSRAQHGAFNALGDISDARVRTIFDEIDSSEPAAGSAERKLADFFATYMDLAVINERGAAPLQPYLAEIAALATPGDLATAFGKAQIIGGGSPLEIFVQPDRANPDRTQLTLGLGGLSMPDRDYYLDEGVQMSGIRAQFVAHVARTLALAGLDDTEARARSVLELETRIAQIAWTRDQRRNRDLTFNPMFYPDFKNAYPAFNWDSYFESAGIQNLVDINVLYPNVLQPFAGLVESMDIAIWQNYLFYQLLVKHAPELSEAIEQENFSFYGRVLSGQPEMRERWERGVRMIGVVDGLGEALGQVYVQKHFPESSKRQMEQLVTNLQAALAQSIAENEWMDAPTKDEANLKLNSFRAKIAYPDEWRDLSGIVITPDSLFANAQSVREFIHRDLIMRLSQPTNKERWRMTPQTVNAGYTAAFNEILFPAAILQPPFFDPAADIAVNYGAIGAVIGHEMGHGFDDQGSKSDYRGVQRNWWTEASLTAFRAKTSTLAQQYDAFEPVAGVTIDGDFTLGENIGDVGGLSLAYRAYKLALGGQEAPIIDGFTGDQRFFLAWAQVWQSKIRDEALLSQLKSDPHSPAEFRVNGVVRNIDAWYDAFNVQPGDAQYLPPDQRVRIW